MEFLKNILLKKAYWCVWSKFHLRSLYQNEIERPDISFGEDVVLSTQLLLYLQKVVSVDYIIIDYNLPIRQCHIQQLLMIKSMETL